VRYRCLTTPFAAVRPPEGGLLARLACLIHAANVHSEPGSNPSKNIALTFRRTHGADAPRSPRSSRAERVCETADIVSWSGKRPYCLPQAPITKKNCQAHQPSCQRTKLVKELCSLNQHPRVGIGILAAEKGESTVWRKKFGIPAEVFRMASFPRVRASFGKTIEAVKFTERRAALPKPADRRVQQKGVKES
jgi:hypothetical protein